MKIFARNLSYILLLVFLFFFLTACERDYYNKILLTGAFTTVNSVELFTKKPLSEEELKTVKKEVNEILIGLDNVFNIQERVKGVEPDTVLYKVGKKAGVEPVKVSSEVIYVLKKALELSEISKVKIGDEEVALFDPTIAPAWKEWDFPLRQYDILENNLIEEEEINEIKSNIEAIVNAGLIDYKKIIINEEESTVYLEKEGMEIDLGAIAKGYAADKVKEYLLNRGYTSAIINIGGNIQLVGDMLGKEYKIGIRTPYINWSNIRTDKKGNSLNYTFGTLMVIDKSVVTSGTYEKYMKDEFGTEYHHILNPNTGMPINNGVISITVVTEQSILADGYSTTLFALGLDRGMEIVESTEEIETVWVVRNGDKKEVYISSGLEDKFTFNENVQVEGYVYKGVYSI